jgi:hypothetical protein
MESAFRIPNREEAIIPMDKPTIGNARFTWNLGRKLNRRGTKIKDNLYSKYFPAASGLFVKIHPIKYAM